MRAAAFIAAITAQSFRPYGRLIDYPRKNKKGNVRNLWRIVLTDPSARGWRIAYLVLRDKTIGRLESHSGMFESFEPVRGRALFFVARRKDLTDVRCFLLDKPVILNKGIWHGLIALDGECEIKITENAKVTCEYWPLPRRIRAFKDLKGVAQ